MVGKFPLSPNAGAMCDSPGIDDTCFGVGIFCLMLGISLVIALSSGIGRSPLNGLIMRPSMMRRFFGGGVPLKVVVAW